MTPIAASPTATVARAAMSCTRRCSTCWFSACSFMPRALPPGVSRPPAPGRASVKPDQDLRNVESARSYDPGMARLLLAEDDAGIREPLARALKREGYDVDEVEN